MYCKSCSAPTWIIAMIAGFALLFSTIALFKNNANIGIQAELVDAGGGIIADGTNVMFDNVVNDQSNYISYNATTDEFTITKRVNDTVSWWAAPDGAGPATTIDLVVAVDGVPYSTASSPIVSDEMATCALVTVDTVPATILLVNVTGEDIFVPLTTVQAGIVITK